MIEARPPEYPESKDDEDETSKTERWGMGPNELVYYVTNSPEDPWKALPQLKPEWVVIARQTRRLFTGTRVCGPFMFRHSGFLLICILRRHFNICSDGCVFS